MCRLYGISGNQPARVECSLVDAQNALLEQSIGDSRGVANPDGWGIGSYEAGSPTVHKSARAAAHDVEFRRTAEQVTSRTVVAHVRAATVGSNTLDNTHPSATDPGCSPTMEPSPDSTRTPTAFAPRSPITCCEACGETPTAS